MGFFEWSWVVSLCYDGVAVFFYKVGGENGCIVKEIGKVKGEECLRKI
jgi:hypothetical protein